ncbi:hypothetical protein Ciccas_005832 [Cichlidogyrus casuarinus]|uniref:Uncharacterized protein n=1 Tax=Cichlidogyrus casuarinus TaxID=1844966 RepID=A0ABD2Q7I0_9PLAT
MIRMLKDLAASNETDEHIKRFEDLVSKLSGHVTPSSQAVNNGDCEAVEDTTVTHDLNWKTQLKDNLEQLKVMKSESKQFLELVSRLVDATEETLPSEACELLSDVKERFIELLSSFESLEKGYLKLDSTPDVPEELALKQLTRLTEYLLGLNKTLSSSKECFFSVARLVKTTISDGLASGSIVDKSEEPSSVKPIKKEAQPTLYPPVNETIKETLNKADVLKKEIDELKQSKNRLLEMLAAKSAENSD